MTKHCNRYYIFVEALKIWWDRFLFNIKFEFQNVQHKKEIQIRSTDLCHIKSGYWWQILPQNKRQKSKFLNMFSDILNTTFSDRTKLDDWKYFEKEKGWTPCRYIHDVLGIEFNVWGGLIFRLNVLHYLF